MKQVVQDFKTGNIVVVDLPVPVAAPGMVLVRNAVSLVSAGTEKATVNLAQASLIGKARSRPDLVKQVFNTVKREGVAATIRKVQSRLDQWKELGYSTAGTIIEMGDHVTGLSIGDRVACAGQDYASHAEFVTVPQNLCTKLPDSVNFSHATFTTLGSIALQGVRQADVRLGECVAVIGLGLVGQLTMQLLKASGCIVLGIDVNQDACELARNCGCDAIAVRVRDDVERIAAGLTTDFGVDAVIITASAPTNDPVELAGNICRDRARVVMVGVTGMEVPRNIYYHKELDFRLSRSYGPGRYDPIYEEKGIDYPIGYVRWSEQRNMEAFVQQIASKRVDVTPLITHTFPVEEGFKAFELITGKTGERFVGVLIKYPETGTIDRITKISNEKAKSSNAVSLGVVGAGNYAQGVLLPLLKNNSDVTLKTVCTATGAKAKKTAEKFAFESCTTDWQELIEDQAVNSILIATRHDLHAPILSAALKAGKTVFCEKPLCIRKEELDDILGVIKETGNDRLMVGFNRRFAPFASKVSGLSSPLVMRYRVSIGSLPSQHWINDPDIGGGRVIGEVCHFVDFLRFTADSRPVLVYAHGFGNEDVQVSMKFANGSVGSVDYFTVGGTNLGKEYFEVFGGDSHIIVDDFRDKGQAEEVRQFVEAVKSGSPMPIPLDEIIESTRATFGVLKAMRTGAAVQL